MDTSIKRLVENEDQENEDQENEAEIYQRLRSLQVHTRAGLLEDLRTTPLLTLAVKAAVKLGMPSLHNGSESCNTDDQATLFRQYATVGFHSGEHPAIHKHEPILLNVDAPNSVFICGSQGSGKSYTLNCILENCLTADRRIGQVSFPVAGVAFHYDLNSAGSVTETAYLCSLGVRVNVFVSKSNEHARRAAYSKLPQAEKYLTVTPLLLRSTDLSIERMHNLMAFADKQTSMPLYMSVALRVLRQMAVDATGEGFNYLDFKQALERENLTKDQSGPLHLRLELLESFLDLSKAKGRRTSSGLVDLEPGTLTVFDLTDPFMDPATVCLLFDICLSLVEENRPSCGLVVVLDEAHKYMTTSLAAANFTERLLGTIREQRHNGTRVIIATQEPTVSEKLLDLCTISIIHRFTSPAWFTSIQNHLGAASKLVSSTSEQHAMFDQIMNLKLGESMVFAPSAFLCCTEAGVVTKLGSTTLDMKTRTRLGTDGGMSVLISTELDSRASIKHDPDDDSDSMGSGVGLEDTRQESIAVSCENKLVDKKSALPPNTARSHLALICCLCERAVLIEFPKHTLPGFSNITQKNLRGGIAYAACVQCQLRKVADTKKASKQYDLFTGQKFLSGKFDTDDGVRRHLQIGLKPILGHDMAVLLRDVHYVYMFLRIIQRTLKDGGSLWTAVVHRDETGCVSIRLSTHEDGAFFKSSLEPQ